MDAVTFYHVEPIFAVGMPLLITAVMEDQVHKWVGEMYLLLQDKDCTVIDIAVRVDGNAWPQGDSTLNEEFLRQELEQQARWRFALYRQDQGHDAKYGMLARPLLISTTNFNAVVAFWMQSRCGDKLNLIRDKTSSDALRSRLELLKHVPRFDYQQVISSPSCPPNPLT
jgi:hypothetical protein